MKVRACSSLAPRAQTRLPATHCRALVEPDDSRIAIQRFRDTPEILTAFDREFDLPDSYVRRRPVLWPVLRPDNRNPRCNRRTDVGGEICSPRNFGSVSVAKEYVQAQWPSCEAIECDPQQSILINTVSSESGLRPPLASILSPHAGRGGQQPSAFGVGCSMPASSSLCGGG